MHRFARLLSLTAALIAGLALQGAPALASGSQQAIFEDDYEMLNNPVGALNVLGQLGVTRVRLLVQWDSIAPAAGSHSAPAGFDASDPAAYPAANWAPYDRAVRAAQAAGIQLFLTLTGPAPVWATAPGFPPHTSSIISPGVWKPSAREFGRFVAAIGQRYSGVYAPRGRGTPLPRVSFWSIWNEPNYGYDLAPQATSDSKVELASAEYRSLLGAAWASLLATGHRPATDTILIGETAPRGLNVIGDFSGIKPVRFVRALYCVDSRYRRLRGAAAAARGCPTTVAGSRRFAAQNPALFQASGFADHPYEQGVAPNHPTVGHDDPPSWTTDPDYADLPEVPRLGRNLDRLQRAYGSRTRFAIWNTEYGYRTRPPDPHAKIGQATAAYYMNWAEYLSWRQRRLASYSQYLLYDPSSGFFASGLLSSSGRPKATFDAYRMPLFLPVTSTRRGRRLEVWGCVRPAHWYPNPQTVQIQFQAGSRGPFRTIATVPIANVRGYFDAREHFHGSGAVRLAWSYPAGPTIHSRVVAITLR
jgi:hypothetical protein